MKFPRVFSPDCHQPLRVAALVASFALMPAHAQAQVQLARPSPQQYAWHEQERIQFVCLDPCTWQGREYDNHTTPLSAIHPAQLDTDQWCQAAKLWGAQQILFVAKHTGGFCWWQTATTQYGIKETPWKGGKGDVLADLSASCHKHGLNLGIYVYPGDDTWGAPMGSGGRTKDPAKQDAYNKVYRQQLTEVLTRYGSITEVWFDGSCVIDVSDILKQHAASAVIFQGPQATIRWPGTESGKLPYPAWNSLKSQDLHTGLATVAQGWQCCATWTAQDFHDGKANLTIDLSPCIPRPGQSEVKFEETGAPLGLLITRSTLLYEGEEATPGLLTVLPVPNTLNINRTAQVTMLKELGYDGVGHLWLDKVDERVKTLDAVGLKLYQIVMPVDLTPGKPPYDAQKFKDVLALATGRQVQFCLLASGGKPIFTQTGQQYQFDTGALRGTLHTEGKSLALTDLTDVVSGAAISRFMGLFSHYRLLDADTRYGDAAWDWPSTARLLPDGAVEVTWTADATHPFDMTATYRWESANALDLATTVTAHKNLRRFEVFLASYFEGFPQVFGYGKPGWVEASKDMGDWLAFPRDPAATAMIADGRWQRPPHPVTFKPVTTYAGALGMRRDAKSGLTALVMAPPAECFAVMMPYGEEAHRSLYLSLFGHDLKDGESATAHARLVIGHHITDPRAIELYHAYLKEIQPSTRHPKP